MTYDGTWPTERLLKYPIISLYYLKIKIHVFNIYIYIYIMNSDHYCSSNSASAESFSLLFTFG